MNGNLQLARLAIAGLNKRDRLILSEELHGLAPAPTAESVNRVLRRREAAARFGVSLRTVDEWTKQGILKKVYLPGRKRSAGFRLADLESLIK